MIPFVAFKYDAELPKALAIDWTAVTLHYPVVDRVTIAVIPNTRNKKDPSPARASHRCHKLPQIDAATSTFCLAATVLLLEICISQ